MTRKLQKAPSKKKITDDYLLKLWGNIVKERAGCKCEYPDCTVRTTQLHPHHWYSRRHASLRYDPMNGIALCAFHHTMGSFSAHSDPDFKDKIISTGVRTPEWNDALREKRNMIVKNNQAFKEDAYENLKKWGVNL